MNDITLGMVLRILREFPGLSIVELSKELTISTTAINHLENDKCKPSAETLAKYSEFFDISSDDILFWLNRVKSADENEIKDILFSMLIKSAAKRQNLK